MFNEINYDYLINNFALKKVRKKNLNKMSHFLSLI